MLIDVFLPCVRNVRTEQVQSRPETRVIQQQHSLPQQSPKSSRVEYSFHIQNTNITIVNGRLIKCLDFWKSELNAIILPAKSRSDVMFCLQSYGTYLS